MQRLAFIGLGSMGAPMAGCLASAGFDLAVFDVSEERMQAVPGARASATPREAADGAEAVVLMVVDGAQAGEALFGDNGAADGLAEGAAVVLMSTVGATAVAELDERVAERSLALLDAPVSGGPRRAAAGELLILAGGARELFERLEPALDAMGDKVVHCGESAGDGQAVKLVNQLLAGVHIAAAAEALAYAERLGIDRRLAWEAVRHGAAASFMLDDRGARMVEQQFGSVTSALDIFVKDMGLVMDGAERIGARAPLAEAARRVYQEGAALGLGAEDDAGVIRVFERSLDEEEG